MFSSLLLLVGLISIFHCETVSSVPKYAEIPIHNSGFQVALYDTVREKFICGGALFNPYYAITAAHCVFSYIHTLYKLKVGLVMTSFYRKSYNIERVIIHRDFKPHSFYYRKNDIALIKLLWPVQGLNILYGILPNENENLENGRRVTVFEFGEKANRNRIQVLQKELNIVSREFCTKQYHRDFFITQDRVCAQNASLGGCVSDVVGPLVMIRTLLEFASGLWSMKRLSSNPLYHLPLVFINVLSYQDWIEHIINKTT